MGDPVSDSLDRVAPRDLSGVHWSISSAGEWGARLSGFKSLFWHVQLGSSEFVCSLGVDIYKALYNSPLFPVVI